ncbi:multiple sugar transport system permease protein [Tessaracoccus bendigoensis DSM 12906]|uniref:Multiple sugar transport system permease protein n=1 Tax=Tessaracoccus bendigoensis DSM 12906 TaxID=1123357 RepID=A0A1M6DEU8_9ACTN|nr:carbohydrate ABC transporter permease [Tessaracoccus bendigoensis]SHI71772.1 multiple sugar transport system permease protein [Tessaracoccus bendigoensis DSM 12906]
MSTQMKTTADGQLQYRPSIEGQPPRSIAPRRPARVITVVLLLVALIYFLFPVYWVIIASSKTNSDLVSTNGFWFANGLNWSANWAALIEWTQGLFPRWVLNSIFYSTASAVVGTLLSVSAGYAMAKFNYPGRNAMLGTIMVGLLMPVALLTVPMYMLFTNMGLNNTIWSILIPCMVSPFGVFLGNVYATTSVPTELLEAARIDGAGEARIFFTMVLRLLAPAMVTIFLFIFVATWNNFMLPLMMISSPELKPVTLGLYGMMSYFSPDRGAVLLGSLVGVLPLVVLFIFLQRYWQSGLAAGAVKG